MNRRRWPWIVVPLVVLALLLARGCALTSHPTQPAALGTSRTHGELAAVLDTPGILTVETVNSADWAVDRSGLINLKDPKAAGLSDGIEPIQVYFHAVRHPTRGLFLIDTGVEKALRDAPDQAAVRGLLAKAAHLERLQVHQPLGDYLKEPVAGVFFTHLHVDHIMGLPDVPKGTPLYAGPQEAGEVSAINTLVRGTTDREFAGHAPLSEWQFQGDGVIDILGDGQLWAIYVPGHTPGSTAYIARTAAGPILFTGDTCHTAWGWQNSVEPGSFTSNQKQNKQSLLALKKLAAEHPTMQVRLGHQKPL